MTDRYDGPEDSSYYWRHLRCRWCGQRYRDFRAEEQPSFEQARLMIRGERDKRISEENDYSKPPCRSRVLWIMHDHKASCWEQVHSRCEEYAMSDDTTVCIEGIENLKGQDVTIFTRLGTRRVGHLTSVRTQETEIDGMVHHVPVELVLDGEEMESVAFSEVSKIILE